MLRGFWKLVWLELKVFVREPMGVLATVGIPLVVFLVIGRSLRSRVDDSERIASFLRTDMPIFACLFIALSACTSLIAIVSIYREGGILKRLRATPLHPLTILGAHVFLKLSLTALTLGLMMLAGRRFYPVALEADLPSFTAALLLSTLSVLSIGFVIASAVPTARFAQPVAGAVLYPLLFISGLFAPIEALPPVWRAIAPFSPLTHAVAFLRGTWQGEAWSAHVGEIGALALCFALCSAVASKIFRWE